MHRALLLGSLLLSMGQSGCRSVGVPVDVDGGIDGSIDGSADLAVDLAASDFASPDLASAKPDLGGAICGDPSSAHARLNGMFAQSPFVEGKLLPLNCCDAAAFEFTSMQLSTRITVLWRHQVGLGPNPPVTIDLAHPPDGWGVSLMAGCGINEPNCMPIDNYNSGFTGTLTVSGDPQGYQMSLCLEVHEPMGSPHPVVHSLELWSPTIEAKY